MHELNLVLAPADAPGERIAAACARLGLPKARLDGNGAGAAFPPGWDVERELVMVRRRPSDRPPGELRVRPVGLAGSRPRRRSSCAPRPHARDPEVRRQLIAQHERWAAGRARLPAPRDRRGRRIVAWCRVYDDGRLAEIDAVGVLPAERGRGLGRALMEGVLERILPGRTVFLVADEQDWPRHLYARLGFDVAGGCVGATRRG